MRPASWLLAAMMGMTAAAQQPSTTTMHTHDTANPDVIDGAKNPELIPDGTAWRLWLLSVTSKDSRHPELDQQRQDMYLVNAGFQEDDLPVARQVLFDFKTAYDALIKDHNSADAAGLSPSLVSLKARRDALVKETQTSLLSIKTETAEKVKNFINGEKARMRVAKTEVQP